MFPEKQNHIGMKLDPDGQTDVRTKRHHSSSKLQGGIMDYKLQWYPMFYNNVNIFVGSKTLGT